MADTQGNVGVAQYWDIDYPAISTAKPLSDGEYIEGLRAVLGEAVRIRLRADVPVGCYLSGGLDSRAALGLAAQHRMDPIRAFTPRLEHEDYDEGVIAREMAEKAAPYAPPEP